MKEVWKAIKGYESHYEISNLGRVKRLAKSHIDLRGRRWGKPELILKQTISDRGYSRVVLYNDKVSKSFKIHRMVAIHFIPNPNSLPEVNHKDCDKRNNSSSNLEWCTRKHNMLHASVNNLIRPAKGEANNNAKLTEEEARFIKENKGVIKRKELASMFKISPTTVNYIQRGNLWNHLK